MDIWGEREEEIGSWRRLHNGHNSEMSHPRCVYINNRCGYQSITQQYLKSCLIKAGSNYMFRPIVAIIRFSSESMVVMLYGTGIGMSRW